MTDDRHQALAPSSDPRIAPWFTLRGAAMFRMPAPVALRMSRRDMHPAR